MASEILYLKLEQNVKVSNKDVFLSDIGKLVCVNPYVLSKSKELKLVTFYNPKEKRIIISVLKIIEMLQTIMPTITVENIGAVDVLIELVKENHNKGFWQVIKIAFLTTICFFGTSFTIMSFHNDVGINSLFSELYLLIVGVHSDGYTVLEFSYSLGLTIGIVIFFNHIGKRKITKDPTPVEVKMRLYEQDVNTALIETGNRKGESVDVD